MIKILLIEDNKIIADNEKNFLEYYWWHVDIIHNWKEALDMSYKYYDLYIIDRMLPSISWIEVVKNIRKTKKNPIIMTTAKWQISDKQTCFELWVDDYLVKPFELEELVMRIKALLNRTNKSKIIYIDTIEIITQEHSILIWKEKILLPIKEYLIVEYLAENKWKIISRTELIDYIRWWDIRKHDASLDVHISNIRKKVWKDFIETIKWFWYKMW
jgi:DNA-binding response OmpR family regulator